MVINMYKMDLRKLGKVLTVLCMLVVLAACRKEPELITGNQPPAYDGVPTLLVRNYVNRLYIDLIGREPLHSEMEADVAFLRAYELSHDGRRALVQRLMTGTDPISGDSSYAHAFHRRQYEMFKARLLESASDEVIDGFIAQALQSALEDSLSGNQAGLASATSALARLRAVKRIPQDYREGTIGMREVHALLVFNDVYDVIHMNTFNFINATFDNLFFRFPTGAEFSTAFNMVEHGNAGVLFGQSGQNKAEYVGIITGCGEFLEGLVMWSHQTLLGREPSTAERYDGVNALLQHGDLRLLQREILVRDEYAGFGQ